MNRKKIFLFFVVVLLILSCLAAGIITAILYDSYAMLILVVVLTIFLNFVTAFRIISSRRTFYAKASWILVITCLPLLGLMGFYILGIYPLKERKNEEYFQFLKQALDKEDYQLSKEIVNKSELSPLFEYGYLSMKKPVYKDNQIEIIEDNTNLFVKSIELIRSAKVSINIQCFIFNFSGFWTKILFTELIKKAKAGIKIRLLYDCVGSWHRIDFRIYKQLEKYGIETGCFNPKGFSWFKGSTNYRVHSKFVIIDNEVALYGGSNFADEYLSMKKSNEQWKDLNFIIKGPIVNSMSTTFFNYWLTFTEWTTTPASKENMKKDVDIIFQKHKFPEAKTYMQLLVFEPDFNEFAMENTLLNAIYNAKSSIKMVTPYFCPSNKIIEALIAKKTEGLDIQLIVHNNNQKYVQMMNNENLEKLLDTGIKIYQYDGYLHTKLNIFDDEYILTGSCNIDYRSIYLDFESWLVIYEKTFTNAMIKYFETIKNNTIVLTNEVVNENLTKWNRFLCQILNIAKTIF